MHGVYASFFSNHFYVSTDLSESHTLAFVTKYFFRSSICSFSTWVCCNHVANNTIHQCEVNVVLGILIVIAFFFPFQFIILTYYYRYTLQSVAIGNATNQYINKCNSDKVVDKTSSCLSLNCILSEYLYCKKKWRKYWIS